MRVTLWLMQHAIHFISFQLLTIIEVDVMLCMKSALDEKKRKKGSRLCRHNFLAIHSHKARKITVIYEFSKLHKKRYFRTNRPYISIASFSLVLCLCD